MINRIWAMPNKNTFKIKPIRELLNRYISPQLFSIDPFANSNKFASITNDIDISQKTDYHLDGIEFVKTLSGESVDIILNDPPYNIYQLNACYQNLDQSVTLYENPKYWEELKKEYDRVLKKNGVIISFSWCSDVMSSYNYEIQEILIVPHGGIHYDTVCCVEKKC